jgi:hypothetical protein
MHPMNRQPLPGAVWIPVSAGELVDKITILKLKCQHLQGAALRHVEQEYALLKALREQIGFDLSEETTESLAKVNAALWIVEDALRDHEARQDFGLQFTLLARQVYQLNDQRHELKQRINRGVGCVLQEEKAYLKYSKSSFDP